MEATIVQTRLFRAVSLAISNDIVRPHLCGIRIKPHPRGGALMAASDGSWMLVARDAAARVTGSGILYLDAPFPMKWSKPGDIFIRDGQIWHDGIREGREAIVGGDDGFKWWKVIPATVSGVTAKGWDPRILAKIAEAAKTASTSRAYSFVPNGLGPALITITGDLFGCISPYAVELKTTPPEWFQQIGSAP